MEHKVSIIVPTYNREKIRALDSIFKQTFKDFEVIVVDDCSTRPIAIPDGVRYFRNEANMGKSYSVNFAVKQSKSPYILVVDDDNEIDPRFLELTIACIEQESAKEIAQGNAPWHAVNTGRIVVHSGFTDYAPPFVQMGYGFTSIDWGWLIRREVFDKIQYDESIFGDEDADFGIQFFRNFKAYALEKPLQTAYADTNDGVSFPSKKRLESLKRFYDKNWREYAESGPKDLSFLNRFYARNLYLGGQKEQAIVFFWRAFRSWPTKRTLLHLLVSLISYKAYYLLMRAEEMYWSRKRIKNYKINLWKNKS